MMTVINPPMGTPQPAPLSLALFFGLIQRWGLLAAALLSWSQPFGAPAFAAETMARTGAVMTLAVNKSQTLRVGRPIGKMAVGSDKVADIIPVSATSVYVLGKAAGTTNLSIFDRAGGLIAVVDVVVTPDADGLKRKLAELLPTEAVGVSVANDSLILEGQVSSAVTAERVAAIAQVYAPGKIINAMRIGSPQQVLLEVRFAEMTRSTVKALGINRIQYSTGSNFLEGFAPGNANNDVYTGVFTFGNLSVQLDALEQQGLVRTLAQPNLVAMSGENAYFLAGGEFPIPVGSNIANGVNTITIEFKTFGVSLTFTPTVLEDGLINLVVAPEVSQIDRAAGISLSSITVPGLRVRRARTTLELRDGQAFAMAGLIQSDFEDTVRQIPLLGRVPIIGALFRSTDYNRTERELVMIVTPHIVRPVAPGSLVTPLDRIREPGDFDLFLNGVSEKRVPLSRLPTTPPGGIDGDAGPIVR